MDPTTRLLTLGAAGSGGGGEVPFVSFIRDASYPNATIHQDGGVVADSNGNIYSIGYVNGIASDTCNYLIKHNSDGTLGWVREIFRAGSLGRVTNARGRAVDVDPSGNVYVAVGPDNVITSNGDDWGALKFDSSGSVLWNRRIYYGTAPEYASSITYDNVNGNVYLQGFSSGTPENYGGGYNPASFILNASTGATVSQHIWTRDSNGGNTYDGDIDSNGKYLQCGYGTSTNAGIVLRAASNFGSVETAVAGNDAVGVGREFATVYKAPDGGCIAVNRYQVSSSPSVFDIQIFKLSSANLSKVWGRRLGTGSHSMSVNSVAVDQSTGDIYIGGANAASGQDYGVLLKLDSSGNIQWQRKLQMNGLEVIVSHVNVDANGDVLFSGWANSGNPSGTGRMGVVGRLPGDGSLTGTYAVSGLTGNFVYDTLSLNTTTSTASISTASGSIRANSMINDSYTYSITNRSVNQVTLSP